MRPGRQRAIAVDLGYAMALAPPMWHLYATSLEVLSRLLGILPSAVGVDLLLQGLVALGGHTGSAH
jgi:hypothetical protein